MKSSLIINALLFLLFGLIPNYAQDFNNNQNYSHRKGLELIQAGKTNKAIEHFKISIDSFSCSDSYYQLAKIHFEKNTVESRSLSRSFIQKAIWKDASNIDYKLLHAKLMEKFSRKMAYDVYEEILTIDRNYWEALFNLGRIKELDFYEYNNSVIKVGSDPSLSFDAFAVEDFIKAERYYKRAIKSDSTLTEAYFHLSCLYEEIEEPFRGIPLLKKVIEIDPKNKRAYTYLGLLYYKTSKMDSSYLAYKEAIKLMDESEKNEFKYQSASFLLNENLREKIYEFSQPVIEESIDKFWKGSDPLLLTNYNERLLEHYSRVAYSNLKFSIPEGDIYGWDTDRGEILIRYGEPVNRIRYRPHISAGGRTSLMLKTDLWFYKNKVLGFVDEYWNGNFRFSTPRPYSRHLSQFAGDTDFFVKDLRRNEPENYEPKFEGPVFNIPYNIVQFKNLEDEVINKTDVYVNYALFSSDQFNFEEKHPLAHKYGVFFLNNNSEITNKKTELILKTEPEKNIKLSLNEEYQVNSILLESEPDTGQLAFEIIRISDNGVSANRLNYKIKTFKTDELDISDILLAEKVNDGNSELTMERGNLNILPNPLNEFTSTSTIYIYYEVYNLSLDAQNTGNFEQRVTISEKDDDSGIEELWSSVTDFLGFESEGDKLTLTTKYQSFSQNVPVYFQVDMSKYKKGVYILSVEVEDVDGKNVVSSETLLRWR
jgi:GWxTD domain-containing protein